jgi:2-phosphoglycerate kinase
MSGMKKADTEFFGLNHPSFSFTDQKTNLFLTGTVLSGKSSIAPLLASRIEGCAVQNMDIFRTWAQDRESYKPKELRNPFVRYGSCDSFSFVGDGSYSPESLITGFNEYAKVTAAPLADILPRLGVQGAQHVLFEGVQLTPQVVEPFLEANNRLIILTSEEEEFAKRRIQMYGRSPKLLERYGLERVLLLQQEILRQSQQLEPHQVIQIQNSGDYLNTTASVMRQLLDQKIIEQIQK